MGHSSSFHYYFFIIIAIFLQKGQQNGEISKDKDIKLVSFLMFTLFNEIKTVSKLEKDNNKLFDSIDNI